MLPLRTTATIHRGLSPQVLKVCGLSDFATGHFPIQRQVFDTRSCPAGADLSELLSEPWAGAILTDNTRIPKRFQGVLIQDFSDDNVIQPGDVIRIAPNTSYVQNLYRRSAKSNSLFVTERCNNFCVMCSQPPREVSDDWRVPELFQTVDLIDPSLEWLGVTGGEPTLLGKALANLASHCQTTLPNTGLHVLTNGRRFTDSTFANLFIDSHKTLTWAVPLYGDTAGLHDFVVQSKGAFADTVRGLYNLHRVGQKIEIRIVLQRPTAERLIELAEFIASSFPFVCHVALMGLEPTGFALANRNAVWIDPADYADRLLEAVERLHTSGLSSSIYNLPLCVLPKELWHFARRSISDWKQRYLPECELCIVRDQCAGFFASHTADWQSRNIHAIQA